FCPLPSAFPRTLTSVKYPGWFSQAIVRVAIAFIVMRKIPETLLLFFLRRYPPPARLSWFNFLGRYVWLKDLLDEVYPQLFPQRQEVIEEESAEILTPIVDARVLGILEDSEIQGKQGCYRARHYVGARGNGHLFMGLELISKRPVTIKEYLLPASDFTKTEAYQRQSSFQRLGGLQLADGRLQDFRVSQPTEAIADTASHERCFLVTDVREQSPTLRRHLETQPIFSLRQVQDILSQILQTLDFLHHQKFNLPSGAIQNGLIHGNLSLDSLLWVEHQGQPFVYLCDLWLWEQWFDSTVQERRSVQATPEARQQDLRAVGEIGTVLLERTPNPPPNPVRVDLERLLDSLKTAKFSTAEAARRALLKLASRTPPGISGLAETTPQEAPRNAALPLILLSLVGLAMGSFLILARWRPTQARSPLQVPKISTCCLSEISAIPDGRYIYTAVKGGTWSFVLAQKDLLQRGRSIAGTLATAQPTLQLQYVPALSLQETIALVQSGAADFAILPLVGELPRDVMAQEIAYDGLAVVVSFSYAERQQGLPSALKGRLTLDQIRQLYEESVDRWQAIGGPDLQVQRYLSDNPEVRAVLEQRVLTSKTIDRLPEVKRFPALDLLRQVIRDFEINEIGSIGITTLSELWGQCSVYPLAVAPKGQEPIQPMILANGKGIDPETNLCTRKGAYGPNPQLFQTAQYPLSYPIAVVYPRDNRRSKIGKKFVEMMRTVEGQQLLKAAGLIPLSQDLLERTRAPEAK
ncbi:MAG: hypothetical protein SFW36_06910, partial [Leptolyngbyaceae cyanobacterium bins.59]|nr:hypothetical protein [Leptolyngbyaceae cyanobacterium bins.59]